MKLFLMGLFWVGLGSLGALVPNGGWYIEIVGRLFTGFGFACIAHATVREFKWKYEAQA